jgi:hypothetical protein
MVLLSCAMPTVLRRWQKCVRSHLLMNELDYAVEPKVESPENDPNDVAFVRVTTTIGGCDDVKEYVTCKLYPLADFESVPPRMSPVSKVVVLKIARSKVKPGLRGTLEIEFALARPIGVSKKFHLLDVAASSHELHAVGTIMTRTARVLAFDNLDDDSSSDVCKTPSSGKTIEKRVSTPHSVSGEFLHFSFMIFTACPDNFFCRSYPACTLARFAARESR